MMLRALVVVQALFRFERNVAKDTRPKFHVLTDMIIEVGYFGCVEVTQATTKRLAAGFGSLGNPYCDGKLFQDAEVRK